MIAEVKDPAQDIQSVITLDALTEIKTYIDQMKDASTDINGKQVYWTDICNKMSSSNECFMTESILEFGY